MPNSEERRQIREVDPGLNNLIKRTERTSRFLLCIMTHHAVEIGCNSYSSPALMHSPGLNCRLSLSAHGRRVGFESESMHVID